MRVNPSIVFFIEISVFFLFLFDFVHIIVYFSEKSNRQFLLKIYYLYCNQKKREPVVLTFVSQNSIFKTNPLKLPIYPCSVGHYTTEKGYTEHERKGFTQFVFIGWMQKGEMEITLYEKPYILYPNDVWIYLPGEDRRRRALSDECEFRWVAIKGERAAGHILAYGYDRIIRNAGLCPVELFQQIMEHISDTDPFMQRMIISWIDQILACAGGRHDNTMHSGRYAARAREIIETQYGNPEININTIADMVGCSRARLSRLFKQEFNRTPGTYLDSIRIAQAGALLRGSDLSVSEIGVRCGIPNLNTFCRFVKRISGFTPLEFRNRRGVD